MSNQTAEEKADLSAKEWMIDQYPENAKFYKNGGASSIFEDMENYAEQRLTTVKEKIKNIDGFKEGECVELLAKDHVLTLIEEELQ